MGLSRHLPWAETVNGIRRAGPGRRLTEVAEESGKRNVFLGPAGLPFVAGGLPVKPGGRRLARERIARSEMTVVDSSASPCRKWSWVWPLRRQKTSAA